MWKLIIFVLPRTVLYPHVSVYVRNHRLAQEMHKIFKIGVNEKPKLLMMLVNS